MATEINNNHFSIRTLIILILIMSSCSSTKVEISKNGNIEDAIKAAIQDYSDFAKRKHADKSVFFVNIKQRSQDIYSFSISFKVNNRIYNEKYLTDSDIEKLPTNYYTINNQLYYWYEEGKKGSRNDIEIFKKYGFLIEDEDAFEMYIDAYTYESLKLTYYYFCKNDLRKYAKIHSSKTEDYFRIPSDFSCNTAN